MLTFLVRRLPFASLTPHIGSQQEAWHTSFGKATGRFSDSFGADDKPRKARKRAALGKAAECSDSPTQTTAVALATGPTTGQGKWLISGATTAIEITGISKLLCQFLKAKSYRQIQPAREVKK